MKHSAHVNCEKARDETVKDTERWLDVLIRVCVYLSCLPFVVSDDSLSGLGG